MKPKKKHGVPMELVEVVVSEACFLCRMEMKAREIMEWSDIDKVCADAERLDRFEAIAAAIKRMVEEVRRG